MTASHDPYQSLRHRDFRWLLLGTTFAFMAAQMQSLVLGWQVYERTHDAMSLGWIGLFEAIPFLGLSLPGGWAADHWDRRLLGIVASSVSLLGAVLLVFMAQSTNSSTVWPFYAIQALAGVTRALSRPASQALGTDLIPRDAYGNAATWRSSCFHFSMVAGPALGGLLFAAGGGKLAYKVLALLYLAGLVALYQARDPNVRRRSAASENKSLGAGVRFVFSNRLILSALSLDLFAVLFGGAIALLPAFAHDVLRVGPAGLGLLRTAPAVGAIAMAMAIAHRRPSERAGMMLLLSVAAYGATWILFAVSRSLPWSLLLLAASGAFDNVSVILRATLVQTQTPSVMMGRVQAVNGFFIGSSNEVGAFESGLAARFLGLVPSVLLGGCMTLVVVALVTKMVPELRRLRRIAS